MPADISVEYLEFIYCTSAPLHPIHLLHQLPMLLDQLPTAISSKFASTG
jgi:hypothetical protein